MQVNAASLFFFFFFFLGKIIQHTFLWLLPIKLIVLESELKLISELCVMILDLSQNTRIVLSTPYH